MKSDEQRKPHQPGPTSDQPGQPALEGTATAIATAETPDSPDEAGGEGSASQKSASPLSQGPWSSPAVRILVGLNAGVFLLLAALFARMTLAGAGPDKVAPGALGSEELKAVATALEQEGYNAAAADAWENYLAAAKEEPMRAEILLQVGVLRINAEQYERAADTFMRVGLLTPDREDFKRKINGALIVCRQLSGRAGEVERLLENARLRGNHAQPNSPVVAALGNQTLTEADLDDLIRRQSGQPAAGEEGAAQRAAELERFKDRAARARLLHDVLQSEVFVRYARELKLDQEPSYLEARRQVSDALLAQRLIARQSNVVPPSAAEMEAFYKEHEQDFRRPEMVRALAIRCADENSAKPLLDTIKSAADFRKVAEAEKAAGGADAVFAGQIARGSSDPAFGNTEQLFSLGEGEWTKGPLGSGDHRYLALVEKRIAAHTASLAESGQEVRDELLRRRRRDAAEKLFKSLLDRYGIKIMLAAGDRKTDAAGSPDAPAGKPGQNATDKAPVRPAGRP